jgi:hypothetical protein
MAAPAIQSAATAPAVLEEKSLLGPSDWNEITGKATLEDGRYKMVFPAGTGTRFYRLRLLEQ